MSPAASRLVARMIGGRVRRWGPVSGDAQPVEDAEFAVVGAGAREAAFFTRMVTALLI